MDENIVLETAYAAYGSNLNLEKMAQRCPNAKCLGKGYLLDYKVTFAKRGFLDVVECIGEKVPVGLFKITTEDLKPLDAYEEYPELYDRIPVTVTKENGETVSAFVYKMNAYDSVDKPSKEYWDIIVKGYQDFDFDPNILDAALKAVE